MPIFLHFLLTPANAEIEYQGETKQISSKYYDGQYLIFDCSKWHWACVDLDGYKQCEKDRVEAREKFRRNLACTPIKEFKTKKECEIYQLKKVNQPEAKKFCIHTLTKNGTTR